VLDSNLKGLVVGLELRLVLSAGHPPCSAASDTSESVAKSSVAWVAREPLKERD
jgi:hypothetical protein